MIRWLTCVAFSILLGSCAGEKKEENPQTKPVIEPPRLVGRIQSRPGGKDFVLIESYGKWGFDEGVNLFSTAGDGSTAALVTSGEKLGQFVAADLLSGRVEVGDAVYFRPKQTSVEPKPVEENTKTTEASPVVPLQQVPSESEIKPVPPANKPLFDLPKW